MKTKEAIPFLIKHIGIDRYAPLYGPWGMSAEVIQGRLAAVAALMSIGPEACRAIIHAYWEPMLAQECLAAIFAVSRMPEIPETRAFPTGALGEANQQRYLAEEGLKRLGVRLSLSRTVRARPAKETRHPDLRREPSAAWGFQAVNSERGRHRGVERKFYRPSDPLHARADRSLAGNGKVPDQLVIVMGLLGFATYG